MLLLKVACKKFLEIMIISPEPFSEGLNSWSEGEALTVGLAI